MDKIQARLDSVLGLHRTMSRDSVVSFAGSINTKKAYKKFCKGLFNIGVTADMISQKEKEIQDIFKTQHSAASNQMGDTSSTSVDPNPAAPHPQLLQVRNPSDAEASPMISSMSTENEPSFRSRFGWVRPPIDFLVGPLMLSAAEAGNTKRLVSTLEFVRNINFTGDLWETALHKAAAEGHKDIVQLLLSKGASIEARDRSSWTPLHVATRNGHTGTVELLLSKGASLEAKDTDGWTPLHHAASGGHTSTVELLLEKGASIEAIAWYRNTPLHQGAIYGHTSTVELLLLKGASLEAMDKNNRTPLHVAAQWRRTSTVELLLEKGASIAAMDINNNTPLDLATLSGYHATAKLLKSKATITVNPGNIGTISG